MLESFHTFFSNHSGKIGQTLWAVVGLSAVYGWISKDVAEVLTTVLVIWTGAYLSDKTMKVKSTKGT